MWAVDKAKIGEQKLSRRLLGGHLTDLSLGCRNKSANSNYSKLLKVRYDMKCLG